MYQIVAFWYPIYAVGGLDMVLKSAAHHRHLLAKGEPVPDMAASLIAAYCIHWKLPLLHSVPAYEPYERHLGLKGSGAVGA